MLTDSEDASLDLSLVLACYNEEAIFEDSTKRILNILDHTRLFYELIFVDDCSQDGTRKLIDSFIKNHPSHKISCIFHERNVGRGRSVTDGFKKALGNVIGFIDIDLEVDASYILTCFLEIQKGADVISANRIYRFYWKGLIRWILSKTYSLLVHTLFQAPVKDTEAGYKFFRRAIILSLLGEIRENRWFWDTEVMVRSYFRGYRIVEVPCLFRRRFDKRSTVKPIRDSLDSLFKLFRLRRMLNNAKHEIAAGRQP